MATDLKGMAVWEILRSLKGLFGTEGGAKEVPLEQQVASMLDPLSDEAIQAFLDEALVRVKGADGVRYLTAIQKVRDTLEPHQKERWRKVIGKMKLTEKFESFTVSETITGGDDQQGQQAQDVRRRAAAQLQQPKQGKGKTERKFDRRPRDYEGTVEDPRVQHLILVADLVMSENDENVGVEKARRYLFSGDYITEKTLTQQTKEKAAKVTEAAISGVHDVSLSAMLGERYDRINRLTQGDQRDKLLSQAARRKRSVKERELTELKAQGLPKWFWIACSVGVGLLVLMLVILKFKFI